MPSNQTTLAAALTTAGVVHTRDAYFDLLEWVDDKVSHDMMRANVSSSLAWVIDNTCINLARSMFFRDYKEAEHDDAVSKQEAYNTFIENFLGSVDFNKAGSEFTDGIARDLTQLLGFSDHAHDLASRFAGAVGRDYQPKSFAELLRADKPMPVTTQTRAKLALVAKFTLEGEQGTESELAAVEKETLDMLLARAEDQAARSHDNRKRLNPIVEGLLDVAQRYKKDDVKFGDLDAQMRERLVIQAIKAVERSMAQLATYNTIDAYEFATIMRNVRDIKREGDTILQTFRTAEEAASITARQRAEKAHAAKSDAPDYEAEQAAAATQG